MATGYAFHAGSLFDFFTDVKGSASRFGIGMLVLLFVQHEDPSISGVV